MKHLFFVGVLFAGLFLRFTDLIAGETTPDHPAKSASKNDVKRVELLIRALEEDDRELRDSAEKVLVQMAGASNREFKKTIRRAMRHESSDVRMRATRVFLAIPSKAKSFPHKWTVGPISFTPDGKIMLTACRDSLRQPCVDTKIYLWSVQTGELLTSVDGHQHWVDQIHFSPSGKTLATSSCDGTAKLWRFSDRGKVAMAAVRTFEMHRNAVLGFDFSKDGKRLVTSSEDGRAFIADVETGETLYECGDHGSAVYSAAFFDNDTKIVTVTWKGNVNVWDAKSGKLIKNLPGHEHAVVDLDVSPDGKQLVTASFDRTARLWDLQKLEVIGSLGCGHYVMDAAFSHDGKLIATCQKETGTVTIWETKSQQVVATASEHVDTVVTVAFSPDGQYLATGSDDRTAKLFQLTDVLNGVHE